MKVLGLILLSSLMLAGCSDSDKPATSSSSSAAVEQTSSTVKEMPLTLKSTEVEADSEGVATIEGTATPGTNVTIGMGILGDSVEADKDGHFTLTHKMVTDEPETITINAGDDSADVTVKLSQAAAEQRAKEADIRNLSAEPTDAQRATLNDLMKQKFKQDYPYKGSKIHSTLGVIQGWTELNGTWFYKAEATIVNAFDAEQEATIEVIITPTDAASGLVEINAY